MKTTTALPDWNIKGRIHTFLLSIIDIHTYIHMVNAYTSQLLNSMADSTAEYSIHSLDLCSQTTFSSRRFGQFLMHLHEHWWPHHELPHSAESLNVHIFMDHWVNYEGVRWHSTHWNTCLPTNNFKFTR